jgi:sterol desaturase/sphingolipid hydroxylase (fatty acid hydroxylase superfamily)
MKEPFNALGILLEWNINTITGLILLLGMVVIVTLERFFPYKAGLSFFRKGFWIDFVWYTLIQSFFLKILIFDWIIAPLKTSLGLAESGYLSFLPIPVLLVLFLITHDFYIYWFHRFQHSNRWLWRTHEAHHSVEEVDWLAGSRSHMAEILINQTIEFLPIFFLLDVETAAVVVPLKALMDALWGQFIHANIKIKWGKWGYIINGPELHLWHHADHPEVYHANFSTKFSVWDWLFGTAWRPGFPPSRYGVWYRFPRDWFAQHVFSFYRFNVSDLEDGDHWLKKGYHIRIKLLNSIKNVLPSVLSARFFPKGSLSTKEVYGPKVEWVNKH